MNVCYGDTMVRMHMGERGAESGVGVDRGPPIAEYAILAPPIDTPPAPYYNRHSIGKAAPPRTNRRTFYVPQYGFG